MDARKFLLESRSNGSVNELEINRDGNGNVDVSKTITKTAKVKNIGNKMLK